jgi:4-hydroxyphenylpyruvate dioxygenase
VFFCQTDAIGATGWLGDFQPSEPAQPGHRPLLTAVDHVALSQPFDYFDEAALFYRSLLGMRNQGSQEVASPYGLVRSRAVRSAGDGVRLVLNVPLLGGGRLPENAAYQHVAFACTDIFAAARAVRSMGAPTLPMPGNYYDDLTARFDLDAALTGQMRELAKAGDGWRVPPNPTSPDTPPADLEWLSERRVDMPIRCFEMKLKLQGGELVAHAEDEHGQVPGRLINPP